MRGRGGGDDAVGPGVAVGGECRGPNPDSWVGLQLTLETGALRTGIWAGDADSPGGASPACHVANCGAMTPELARAIKPHSQWFGSYKKSGELKKIRVWLTVNQGRIEFLTGNDSYKAKRIRGNPRVVCFLGRENGPAISGRAEILMDREDIERVHRGYEKSHPFMMLLLGRGIRKRIESGEQVVIRVHPDEPNPLDGLTDPVV